MSFYKNAFIAVLLFSNSLFSQQEPELSAEDILRAIRPGKRMLNMQLRGTMRDQESGDESKVEIIVEGTSISLESLSPAQSIKADYSGGVPFIRLFANGSYQLVKQSDQTELLNSAALISDFAVPYFYWQPTGKPQVARGRGRNCWVVGVVNPMSSELHRTANIWIDKVTASPVKIEIYDGNQRVCRRIEVVSLSFSTTKGNFPKTIRFEQLSPVTKKVTKRSYLQLTD